MGASPATMHSVGMWTTGWHKSPNRHFEAQPRNLIETANTAGKPSKISPQLRIVEMTSWATYPAGM